MRPRLQPLLFVALALGIFLLTTTLSQGAPTLLSYNANNASVFVQVSENGTGTGLLEYKRDGTWDHTTPIQITAGLYTTTHTLTPGNWTIALTATIPYTQGNTTQTATLTQTREVTVNPPATPPPTATTQEAFIVALSQPAAWSTLINDRDHSISGVASSRSGIREVYVGVHFQGPPSTCAEFAGDLIENARSSDIENVKFSWQWRVQTIRLIGQVYQPGAYAVVAKAINNLGQERCAIRTPVILSNTTTPGENLTLPGETPKKTTSAPTLINALCSDVVCNIKFSEETDFYLCTAPQSIDVETADDPTKVCVVENKAHAIGESRSRQPLDEKGEQICLILAGEPAKTLKGENKKVVCANPKTSTIAGGGVATDPSRVQPCYFSSSSGLSDTCKCSVPPYLKLSDGEGNTRTRQYWREGGNYTCLFPKDYYIQIQGPEYNWDSKNIFVDGKALGKITSLTWIPPKPGLYQILGSTTGKGLYQTLIADIEIQGAGPTFWEALFYLGFTASLALGGVWAARAPILEGSIGVTRGGVPKYQARWGYERTNILEKADGRDIWVFDSGWFRRRLGRNPKTTRIYAYSKRATGEPLIREKRSPGRWLGGRTHYELLETFQEYPVGKQYPKDEMDNNGKMRDYIALVAPGDDAGKLKTDYGLLIVVGSVQRGKDMGKDILRREEAKDIDLKNREDTGRRPPGPETS